MRHPFRRKLRVFPIRPSAVPAQRRRDQAETPPGNNLRKNRRKCLCVPARAAISRSMRKEKLRSRKQALEWTRDLWNWLCKNPRKEKHEWPGWTTRSDCKHHCPCCEYATSRTTGRMNCDKCPLLGHWGEAPYTRNWGCQPCVDHVGLTGRPSPFWIWLLLGRQKIFDIRRQVMARLIAKAAEMELADL